MSRQTKQIDRYGDKGLSFIHFEKVDTFNRWTINFNPYHRAAGDSRGGEFTSGPSSAVLDERTINDEVGVIDELMEVNKKWGTEYTPNDIADLAGAQPGSNVTISYQADQDIIVVETNHPDYQSVELIQQDKIIKDSMKAKKKGKGIGTEVVLDQVEAAIKHEMSEITLFAAGSKESMSYNGYYTWPRLGYDVELKGAFSTSGTSYRAKEARKKFGATKVSDLMKSPEGREWWKENGKDAYMKFDLKEGSLSRKVLHGYAKAKTGRAPAFNERGRGDLRRSVGSITVNTRWQFLTVAEKVKRFQEWLLEQIKKRLLSVDTNSREPWLSKYIHSAYRRGMVRAFIDAKTPASVAEGARFEGFLESAFAGPIRASKLELLSTRAYEQLHGVTNTMAQNMNRVLTEEMAKGSGIKSITKRLTTEVDNISKVRAERIARTEIIHAHAEGQLDAFEEAGIEEVNVMAEWITAAGVGATEAQIQASGVCKQCAALSGVVMTVKEARGLLPRHPNCRCAWLPANVGERGKKQVITKPAIEKAIGESVKAETGKKTVPAAKRASRWQGADRKVKTKDMRSKLATRRKRKPRKVRASFGKTFSKPLWSE